MSLNHHGSSDEQSQLHKLFLEQATGTAKRAFPSGRMGAEDDGQLTYAMATDDRHKTIVIRFPKPVDWIGLDVKAAEDLRDQLTERLMALRGIKA
jgi:hypothetical protein